MYLNLVTKKRKGENSMLPTELMNDFMGKVCSITLFNAGTGFIARIESVEGNWLKVNEKGKKRLINGDMVRDIEIMAEKYQNKY